MRRTTVLPAAFVLVLVLGLAPACSSSEGDALPPPTKAALVRLLSPRVTGLDLRFTRAGLQDATTYEYTPEGRHLALYLEPTASAYSAGRYTTSFVRTAKALVPYVLDRWHGIHSVDVCLEPLPSVDPSPVPKPVTTVIATRKGADHVDWSHLTAARLVAASFDDPVNMTVRVSSTVSSTPGWASVLSSARRLSR